MSNIFCKLDKDKLIIYLKDLERRDKVLPISNTKVFIEEDGIYVHLNRLYEVFYAIYKYVPYLHDKRDFSEFIKEKPITKKELCNLVETINKRITREEKSAPCKKIDYSLQPRIAEFTCLELPLMKIKYIIGPCTYYEFKLGNRNIHLFGERHDLQRLDSDLITTSNSLIFSSFVHSVVNQNPEQTYDLMFEYVLFLRKEKDSVEMYSESASMNNIVAQFKNCIHFSRRNDCNYNNLRVHYIDYRLSEDAETILSTHIDDLKDKILALFNTPKMLKQISAIKSKYIRNKFVLFISNKITEEYNKIIKRIEIYKRANIVYEAYTVDLETLVMDMYGIARVLRDFDINIEKYYKSSFKGTSDNVIYYAGNYHITTMVEFFTKYLKISPEYKVKLIDSNCKNYLKIDMARTSFV